MTESETESYTVVAKTTFIFECFISAQETLTDIL